MPLPELTDQILTIMSSIQSKQEVAILNMPNVVGMGIGVHSDTSLPCFHVFVTRKVTLAYLPAEGVIPEMLDTFPVEIIQVGRIVADALQVERIRPVRPGYSVGHYAITAGTIGGMCYDFLPGAETTPPQIGIGQPKSYYILSNNHVLANSNRAAINDPILQPGAVDGGAYPRDMIGRLKRFIPIDFAPAVPKERHNNLVDCAIAEVDFKLLNRQTTWSNVPRAWMRKDFLTVGTLVKKSGRTSGFSTGRVLSINAVIDVGYGNNQEARFRDQFIVTNISQGGDSGSFVYTNDDTLCGLLFAGSSEITICNHIETVRALLRVEVSETIQPEKI